MYCLFLSTAFALGGATSRLRRLASPPRMSEEIVSQSSKFCASILKLHAMLHRRGLSAPRNDRKRDYHRDCLMSQAEIMVIMIMFHSSNHKCLKHFYLNEICVRYRHLFPDTVSYGRFTELEKSIVVQSVIFVKKCLLGKCTGISFVDSTLLRGVPQPTHPHAQQGSGTAW